MRKRVIPSGQADDTMADEDWLDVESLAQVEFTSEDPDHPVESALLPARASGWRAAGPGEQTIRLHFDSPQRLRRVRLEFVEPDLPRTQEFVLRWSDAAGQARHEIVRQQWNFSPGGADREVEDLAVDLRGVGMLELTITPDVSGGPARASLEHLQLA